MESNNQNQTEISKTNFVTIRIDYPTCYRLQAALYDTLNNQRSEPSYYNDLWRFRYLLHQTVYSVLQNTTAVDNKVLDLYGEPDELQQVIDENPF
jgi:hypothetical protein